MRAATRRRPPDADRGSARAGGRRPLPCDVSGVTQPDLGTVDSLARLQLCTGRLGRRLLLQGVSPALRELLVLAGLDEVLAHELRSGLESGRQAEEREHPRRVEVEGEATEPPA